MCNVITCVCMWVVGTVVAASADLPRGQSSAVEIRVLRKPSCRHPRSLHSSVVEVPILCEKIHEFVIFSEVYSVPCLERRNAQPAMSRTGLLRGHLVWLPPLAEPARYLMSFWDGSSLPTLRFPQSLLPRASLRRHSLWGNFSNDKSFQFRAGRCGLRRWLSQ